MTKTVALRNSEKITVLNKIYFLSVQIISPSYNDLNLQVDEKFYRSFNSYEELLVLYKLIFTGTCPLIYI